jgi:hypothetical protein
MDEILFPFSHIVGTSQLALTGYKINATGEKDSKGEVIPHRIDVVALDSLKTYRVKCDNLDNSIISLSAETIASSVKSRQYHYITLDGATAKPYANSGGFGVAYSIRAKGAKIEIGKKPAASQGFPENKA